VRGRGLRKRREGLPQSFHTQTVKTGKTNTLPFLNKKKKRKKSCAYSKRKGIRTQNEKKRKKKSGKFGVSLAINIPRGAGRL